MSIIIVDDTDPAIIYSSGWSQIGTVTPETNEYNATTHQAAVDGLTGEYTWSGGRITVVGTLEYPSLYGYPSVTYTFDGGTPTTQQLTDSDFASTDFDPSGVTPRMVLYQSAWVAAGTHTLKWSVGNVSPTGAKFDFDWFMIELAATPSTKNSYIGIDDRDGGITYSGNWAQGGITQEWMNTDTTASSSGSKLSYTFTGTGITAYGTIYPNQNPAPQINIQVDSSHSTTFTAPTLSQTTTMVPLFQISGLSQEVHTITLTSASTSLWSFDCFVYQPYGGPNPNFYFATGGSSSGTGSSSSSSGNSGSSSGSSSPSNTSTATPTGNGNTSSNSTNSSHSTSTAPQQSVFVSYSLSNGVPVPATTYTLLPGNAAATGVSQSTGVGGSKNGMPIGVAIGVALAGVAGIVLFLFLLWWLRRRRRMEGGRRILLEDANSTKERVGYADTETETAEGGTPASIDALPLPTGVSEKALLSRRYAPGSPPAPPTRSNSTAPSRSAPSASTVTTANTIPSESSFYNDTPTTFASNLPMPASAQAQAQASTRVRSAAVPGLVSRGQSTNRPRGRRVVVIRETDGGVRIASGDHENDNEEDGSDSSSVEMEILPPSYEQHRTIN